MGRLHYIDREVAYNLLRMVSNVADCRWRNADGARQRLVSFDTIHRYNVYIMLGELLGMASKKKKSQGRGSSSHKKL